MRSEQLLLNWKMNALITILIMTITTWACGVFFSYHENNINIAITYVLSTVLISRFTTGYVWGVLASFAAAVCLNYAFTYPYMDLNFSVTNYTITFIGMLLISVTTTILTAGLKERNRILSEREKFLMEAEKENMRANLLRAISHDLRTPLTAIIGMADAYGENSEFLDEDHKHTMVKNISEEANWLMNMVENLLSVTRIRDGAVKVNTTMEPVEEVMAEAVIKFRKRMKAIGNIGIQINVQAPDKFIMAPMDAMLIEQVIINLLENAVYHSGSTDPIDFFANVEEDQIYFHIRDYGKGIDMELLDHLMTGEELTPSMSTDYHKGMGIGLTICRTIIEAHNGSINAKNHDLGAEMEFSLPLLFEGGGGAKRASRERTIYKCLNNRFLL